MLERLRNRTTEQEQKRIQLLPLIEQRLQEGAVYSWMVNRDTSRRETLGRLGSERTENPFTISQGDMPNENPYFHLARFKRKSGDEYDAINVDGNQMPFASATRSTGVIFRGLIYRPSDHIQKFDVYNLIFVYPAGREEVIEVATPFDHHFNDMTLTPMLTQILLKIEETQLLKSDSDDSGEYRVGNATIRRQSQKGKEALARLLTKNAYKSIAFQDGQEVDFGFNPLTTGGTSTTA